MKKVWRKGLSLLLTLCMLITMAPAMAWAAEDQATKLDVAKGDVVINSDSISGKDESGMEITNVNPNGYYLMSSTTPTEHTVTINSDCTIYLGGLDILVSEPTDKDDYVRPNPININGNYAVTMILVDGKTNTLASAEGKDVGSGVRCGSGKAAIRVPAGASLTIEGNSGVLNAVGAQGHNKRDTEAEAGGGAGIGGNGAWATGSDTDAEGSGSITINGGVINATGGDAKGSWGAGGAGIGGGGGGYQKKGGASEEITIAGGTVTAAAGKGQTVFTPIGAGGSGGSSYGKAETKPIAVNGGYLSLKSKMELTAKSVLSIGNGGQVEFSPGSKVKIADSILTLPDSGGIITGGEDGKLTVPIGTAIQKGDGEPYTVSDGGTSIDPYVCHKVTINPDNGTGTTTRDIRHNTVFNASELEKPTKSGYKFIDWAAGGKYVYQITVTKDIELIAQWERETYKVTINPDNGSANTEKFYGYEEVLKTSELETPTKSGYKFLGWAVDGKLISDDGIKVTENIEIIAQWKKAHNVTINPDNGSEKAVKIVADGEVLKTSELETPTRSGYKFRGWTVDGKDVSDEITVTKDIELIAQWKKKSSDSDPVPGQEYKISADSSTDNGKVELSPSKAQKGDKVTITVTPDKGYVIGKVTGKAANGNKLEIKENGSGEYTFTMPDCQVEVKATFVKAEGKTEEAKSEEEKSKEEKSKKEKPIILTIHQKVANVFGQPVVTDAAPVIRNNRTMLPIRFIAEALGATVAWDSALNKASVTKGEDVIDIYIGSAVAFVNGNPIDLDSPAFIENSRTYLPLRFVAENLGATVSWNAETQEVTILPAE